MTRVSRSMRDGSSKPLGDFARVLRAGRNSSLLARAIGCKPCLGSIRERSLVICSPNGTICEMAIAPTLTFEYGFTVQTHSLVSQEAIHALGPWADTAAQQFSWGGQGCGRASFGEAEGLVGPRPEFVLSGGWLTLRPSEHWTQSFPIHWFSDAEPRQPGTLDTASYFEDQQNAFQAAMSGGQLNMEVMRRSMEEANRRRGRTRDLASYSVYVGPALGGILRVGDELKFSRDGNGDYRYSVRRNAEIIFSVGPVARIDEGGPIAVWQEYDKQSNPYAQDLRARLPSQKIAEWIDIHRPHVTVRIREQMFYLLDGEEAFSEPYYVFLARSNKKVPPIAFEFTP
jgi:hypothetical protein